MSWPMKARRKQNVRMRHVVTKRPEHEQEDRTLTSVRVITDAVEKQSALHIPSVCL
jgi:hypothetical protein